MQKIMPQDIAKWLSRFVILQIIFALLALILFWTICYIFVPNVSNTLEIRLSLTKSDKYGRVFSTDIFPLSEEGSSFFTPGQEYKIEMLISIPDSPQNRDVEMSTTKLQLYSIDGNRSITLSNTILPKYRPWLIDTMDTVLYAPLYLINLCRKEQKLHVVFTSHYYDSREFPTGSGRLILETNGLRWYSTTLAIYAALNPLVWLIFQYTWLIGILFVIVVTVTLDCFILVKQLVDHFGPRLLHQIGEYQTKGGTSIVETISPSKDTKE